MKKLITSVFFSLIILSASAASDEAAINNLASDIARRMANQVELNEMEYIQVKKYTVEKLTKVERIKDMYSNDLEMMSRRLLEEEAAYTLRIRNLLSSRQFEMYAALQNSFKTNLSLITAGE